MRKDNLLTKLASSGLVLALLTTPAMARTTIAFDPPLSVVEKQPTGLPGWDDAVSCIYYADAVVRVPGADTPSPGNALIVPLTAGKPLPDCGRIAPSQVVELQSGGSSPVGRIGDFLVFEWSDPTGAGNFSIFNIRDGRKIFQDGLLGADGYLGIYGITAVSVSRGILHMRYLRGVNVSCSLLSDRNKCWSQILTNGDVPRGVFSGPPAVKTCEKSYESDPVDQRSPDPNNDPSIISYEVSLTLDSKGNAQARPLGTLRCDPQP